MLTGKRVCMKRVPRGIARCSVRPWRVWKEYKSFYLVQVSDQRGTCLVEKPANGWPVSLTAS